LPGSCFVEFGPKGILTKSWLVLFLEGKEHHVNGSKRKCYQKTATYLFRQAACTDASPWPASSNIDPDKKEMVPLPPKSKLGPSKVKRE